MVKNTVLEVVKATLAAIIFSLIFVLIFTFIIQVASLSASVIKPVNQIFKTLAIAVGVLIFVRGDKGFLKGGVAGLCSVFLTYILFSIIGGSWTLSWTFLLEVILGVIAGIIAGIIAVNVKKS